MCPGTHRPQTLVEAEKGAGASVREAQGLGGGGGEWDKAVRTQHPSWSMGSAPETAANSRGS